MKSILVLALVVTLWAVPAAVAQSAGGNANNQTAAAVTKTPGCANCGTASLESKAAAIKTIPGTSETMVVGSIENLIPIGVLTVLGCEKCSAEAVNWALQQGSSYEDIERTLRTVAAMQKLDCFKAQFGPEVVSRLEKPLAAAKAALDEARTRAAK